MSLRLRLFLLLSLLVLALVGTQAVLVRALARNLHEDVRTVAFRVGEEILSGFVFHSGGDEGDGEEARGRVVVVTPALPEPEGAAAGAAGGAAPGAGEHRLVIRRELSWQEAGGVEKSTRVEKKFDVQILPPAGAPAGAGEAPAAAVPLRLEPGREPDVLFLRGPAAVRSIPIPRTEVSSTVGRFHSQLLAGALAVAAAGLAAAALVAQRLARPLAELAGAARRVGEGELGVEVAATRHDEVGVAVEAFNRMSRRLAHLDAENRRLAASERLSELSEVARGLAHTLRNPLNALGLSVEELAARAAAAEPGASAGALDLADAARRQIRRIDGSLRSFLALASAGAAAAERVDVATLAREVALEALQDGAGRVRIEVDAPAPAEIAAVPAEVKAVLQALVVNAVEASPDGARVRLAVAAGAAGGVELEVEDEGAGLPDEVRRRLFSPHLTTKPHGSGMGLFLAHRIAVGRYGGALALEPGATGGTRARLLLADRRESDGGPGG